MGRLLAGAAVALAVLAPRAGAAQVGIHLGGVSADPAVFARIGEAHPGWVNVFMGWNGVELAKGQYNESLLQSYKREFAALPAGTKVNVNVAGTPAWAGGGSTDTRQPPANPQDYADFLRYVAGRFAGRRDLVGDVERGGLDRLVARRPGDLRRTAQGRPTRRSRPATRATQVVFGGPWATTTSTSTRRIPTALAVLSTRSGCTPTPAA